MQKSKASARVGLGAPRLLLLPPLRVRLALGRPLRTAPVADGGATWFYRDRPRDPNDYIAGGIRYRVVFDPVTRRNITTTERVHARLYPHLRTHLIQVSMRDGRVSSLKIAEDI